jgi:hypothetical protein
LRDRSFGLQNIRRIAQDESCNPPGDSGCRNALELPLWRTLPQRSNTRMKVDAITSQIIPSTDGPGAHEAGIVFFIDRALSTFDANLRAAYHTGMAEVQQKRKEMFPGSYSIAALSIEQQIRLIHAVEATDFFELLRTHTLYGFLGNPNYGGNRDRVG